MICLGDLERRTVAREGLSVVVDRSICDDAIVSEWVVFARTRIPAAASISELELKNDAAIESLSPTSTEISAQS